MKRILILLIIFVISEHAFSSVTVPNCGHRRPHSTPFRIYNGQPAARGEFPWMVSLQRNNHHHCGGSIINGHWILTAAHCVVNVDKEHHKVTVINSHEYSVIPQIYNILHPSPGLHRYPVQTIIPHEGYTGNIEHDMALVKVNASIPITYPNGDINGICLPAQNSEITGIGYFSGWGGTEKGGLSDILKEFHGKIVSDGVCHEMFHEHTNNMICMERGKDYMLGGDSGGPMIGFPGGHDPAVQLGVSSLVIFGGGIGLNVWTKVSHYVNWIEKTIAAH